MAGQRTVLIDPDGTLHEWAFVVIERSTGVVYQHQFGGTANRQGEIEGYLVPVDPSHARQRLDDVFVHRLKGVGSWGRCSRTSCSKRFGERSRPSATGRTCRDPRSWNSCRWTKTVLRRSTRDGFPSSQATGMVCSCGRTPTSRDRTSADRGEPLTLSANDARSAALRWIIDEWAPDWEPAITEIQDAGNVWRAFYNSRTYVETLAIEHALAGNLPLLIDKNTGEVVVDNSYAPASRRRE